jgi:hypothetical protein
MEGGCGWAVADAFKIQTSELVYYIVDHRLQGDNKRLQWLSTQYK